jgi:hypothetical protein
MRLLLSRLLLSLLRGSLVGVLLELTRSSPPCLCCLLLNAGINCSSSTFDSNNSTLLDYL